MDVLRCNHAAIQSALVGILPGAGGGGGHVSWQNTASRVGVTVYARLNEDDKRVS